MRQYMKEELAKYDARIDAIYYCPHHPDEGCECRKPKPKLILQAAAELGVSLELSYIVGDTMKDVRAGKAAGCKAVLLNPDPNLAKEDIGVAAPDYIAPGLLAAVRWIIEKSEKPK